MVFKGRGIVIVVRNFYVYCFFGIFNLNLFLDFMDNIEDLKNIRNNCFIKNFVRYREYCFGIYLV